MVCTFILGACSPTDSGGFVCAAFNQTVPAAPAIGLSAELLAALPALLPGEWQLLQEAGEAELLAECMLALLCEYDPELGYQLLLSYCSSLPARSSSLPRLCMLLSARLPRPDMTELLWSCLHSTLAKLGTETGKVAALLDTLPDCPGLQVARNMLESRNTETQ